MAGSGLPSGGLSLPYGAGATLSFFAVDPNKAWLANNTYPTGVVGGAPVTNFMYGIIPGAGNGMELGGPANDNRNRTGIGRDHNYLCRLRFPAESVHGYISGG